MILTKSEIDNLIKLYKEDFANFFSISFDGNNYKFNINKNIYFSNVETLAPSYYYNYEIKEKDTWPLISFKEYGTIELWWLICRVNQIWNPTENPVTGNMLKILNADVVDEIIATIN